MSYKNHELTPPDSPDPDSYRNYRDQNKPLDTICAALKKSTFSSLKYIKK